jgi:hypothetical protein
MNYGEILGTSWKITWKHKTLWLFGIAAMLVGLVFLPFIFVFNPAFAPLISPDLASVAEKPWFIVIPLAIEFLMMLVMYPVGSLMMAATDLGVLRVDGGKDKLSFIEILKDGLPFFWRTLGIGFVYFLSVTLVMTVLMAILVGFTFITLGFGALCTMPLMLVLTPVMYLAATLMELAIVAIVADNLRFGAAIKQAWNTLRKHFWPLVGMTAIIYLGIGMVTSFFMMPMFLPLLVAPFFLYSLIPSGTDTTIIFIITGIWIFGFFLVFAVFNSWVMAFTRSAWTITYLRLTRPPIASVEPAPTLIENAPVSN